MMLLWACAGVPLGVYNIISNFNIALQVQPQILTVLSLITWAQCQWYGKKWSMIRCCAVVAAIGMIMAGVECGLIFALRRGKDRGLQWPVTLMAVLAALLLSLGVLRHYWDIYKERTVRGISFLFVTIDALGDLTSLISVLFEPKLDILGMVIYGSELVLWIGVMAAGGYYNLIPWASRRLKHWRNGQNSSPSPPAQVYERSNANSTSTVFQTASSTDQSTANSPPVRLRNTTQSV